MNNTSIHKIEKLRIQLTLVQAIRHYSFAIYPLIILAVALYYKTPSKPIENSLWQIVYLICFGLSAFIVYLKYQELILERFYVKRTDKEFKDAALATANKMKWSIENLSKTGMNAVSKNSWTNNNWSTISICKRANYVEIKSLYKTLLAPPDIFGVNKKNRMDFLSNYILSRQLTNLNDRVVKELKAEEQRIENEPEWNLKNTLKRMIAYVISLILLAMGIAIWRFDGFSLFAIVLVIFGPSYIIFDIYVMWTKSKKANSKSSN